MMSYVWDTRAELPQLSTSAWRPSTAGKGEKSSGHFVSGCCPLGRKDPLWNLRDKQTKNPTKKLTGIWNELNLFINKILPFTVKQLQSFFRARIHQSLLLITELSSHSDSPVGSTSLSCTAQKSTARYFQLYISNIQKLHENSRN